MRRSRGRAGGRAPEVERGFSLRSVLIPVAVLATAASSTHPPQSVGVELALARTFRSGDVTLVDGICRVPFDLLEPLGAGADARAYYRVGVTVRDSSGLTLQSSAWTQEVSPEVLRVDGGSSVEHFEFRAMPGRYTVEVAVTDSASGRVQRVQQDVRAFAAAPRASDLLLTSTMRSADGADTVPLPGELRKGTTFLTAVPRPALTPRAARLFYYLELYPGAAATVETRVRILGSDGREVIASNPASIEIGAEGGVTTRGMDLTGLPPGDYRLAVTVAFPDTTVERTAPFTMATFETETALSQTVQARSLDEFAHLAEVQLDSLYEPLVYVLEDGERGLYEGLSVEGKRTYLRRFWAKRDPTPGTGLNEAQQEYYGRIQEASRRFREGGAADVPGWRTDRGRIFIRYGAPQDWFNQPEPVGAYAYELWKYTSGKARKFLFIDETGFGNYVLAYTDERREPSRPGGLDLLDPEDVRRINAF